MPGHCCGVRYKDTDRIKSLISALFCTFLIFISSPGDLTFTNLILCFKPELTSLLLVQVSGATSLNHEESGGEQPLEHVFSAVPCTKAGLTK